MKPVFDDVRSALRNRSQFVDPTAQALPGADSEVSSISNPNDLGPSQSEIPNPNSEPAEIQVDQLSINQATAPTPTANSGVRSVDRRPDQLTLRVRYLETDRRAIAKATLNKELLSEAEDIKLTLIPTKPALMELSKASQELQKVEKKFDPGTLEHSWFIGHRSADREQDLGLTTQVQLASFDSQSIRGELIFIKSLREVADSALPSRKTLTLPFEMNSGSALLIQLNLPKIPQEDEDISSPGVMSLFRSDKFMRKNESEFTIVVEFDSPSFN